MARPWRGPDRRVTAALLVLLFVSCLFTLGAATTDSGHHVRSHPAAHVLKDAGKLLVGSGVRSGGDGGWPALGASAAAMLAVLVLTALRHGRRDTAGQQCHAAATSSRGPPGRPVLA